MGNTKALVHSYRRSSRWLSWLAVASLTFSVTLASIQWMCFFRTGIPAIVFSSQSPQNHVGLMLVLPLIVAIAGAGMLLMNRRRRVELDAKGIRLTNEFGKLEGGLEWSEINDFRIVGPGSENVLLGNMWVLEAESTKLYLSDESSDWWKIRGEIVRHLSGCKAEKLSRN